MDQRIENTYNSLQRSMRALLGQTSWEKITVQMLCEEAGISRTTFYAHFKHKEELLDSLLLSFEQAMLSENNARSLMATGTFRFLPILVNHVNGNRRLFAKTNTAIEGYPVAIKFRGLINRLVLAEFAEAFGIDKAENMRTGFIAGGIYSALVHWSATSDDATHLKLLNEIDLVVQKLL